MNPERYSTYKADDFIFDEEFRELLRKPDSVQLITDLIDSLPEKRYDINLAIEVIRGLHVTKFQQPLQRKKELWQQVIHKQRKHYSLTYLKYTAIFFLLLSVGSTIFYLQRNISNNKVLISKQATPDNTILILANGETVSISSKQSTIQYSADGSGVLVNDSSDVAQSVKGNGLNKMIVPYGKRSTITLCDGTKVWLNSGSSLVFPPAFKGKSREVTLIGEAYFDVTHNKEKPFFVKTDAFRMKVYGTKFDVQAYKQDNAYSIVLVEGKVSMKSNKDVKSKEVFLAPSQKATLSDGESTFTISKVENTDVYTSWTDGYLIFNNEDISHLLKQVSRYYKVEIDVEVSGNVDKIYGKLDLKDNLEHVLDGISFISKTKYKKIGNKYEFYE